MRTHDIIIIGAGSGNMLLTPDFDDWDVAVVEKGEFGGTCLNRGCIPSKMFVYAAELAHLAETAPHYGVHSAVDRIDWKAIRDRVFNRIDPIAAGGQEWRASLDNTTVYPVHGRFVGPKQLAVGDEVITADTIVLAAGARVAVPDIPGLSDAPFHTSDDIMRVDEVPDRLIVIGGGFIAAELGNVFGSFGSQVTFLARGDKLLRHHDHDVAARFTDIYAERFDVRLDVAFERVTHANGEVTVHGTDEDGPFAVCGDALLVATGRLPNADTLDVAATGVAVDADGYVMTDAHMRTSVDGIWALGDITNPAQLKHSANAESRVIAHNIIHADDLRSVDLGDIPHAVFGNPQVASIGMTEMEARAAGHHYTVKVQPYGAAAMGWAMEDATSFVKVIADAKTRLLLGAHIIGPQASTLIQQLIQGKRFGQTVDEMAAGQFYIHPALPEVVEQALLEL